ncbi:MAG: HU family DNA-binding protein [Balneolaceae bacterium]
MSKKITFSDLAEEIASRAGKEKGFSRNFLRELVGVIESSLRNHGSVSISGFGKFELRWMDEREGVHPQTGEPIQIPGQNKVVFKPWKSLRNHVNRPYAGMSSQILPDTPESGSKEQASPQATPVPSDAPFQPESVAPDEEFQSSKAGVENDPFSLDLSAEEGDLFGLVDDLQESEEDEELVIVRDRPPFEEESSIPLSAPPAEAPVQLQSDELIEQVERAGSFRWSWLAAAAVMIMVILALYYTLPDIQRSSLTDTSANGAPATVEQPVQPAITDLVQIDVLDGESLWQIAEERLGNPYLWPWIYHINRDRLSDPNQIEAGDPLLIPEVNDDFQPDATALAETSLGYLDLYIQARQEQSEEARFFLWAAASFNPEILDEARDLADPADLAFAQQQ